MNFEIECDCEDDGRCSAEVPQLPGVLRKGRHATRRPQRCKCSRYASLLNDSSTARAGRSPSRFPSQQRDPMAFGQDTPGPRIAEHSMATVREGSAHETSTDV